MSNRSRFIFYFLSIYVLIQFLWWSYLLYDNSRTINALGGNSRHSEIFMIVGEGLVFFVILTAGILVLYSNFRRRERKAKAEQNFMLAIAHELRTPLASTRLMLQTIRKRDVSQPQKESLIDAALSENRRLTSLTENILITSQLEGHATQFVKHPVDVAAVVRDVEHSARNTFGTEHVIVCDMPEELFALADESALSLVISNLMENACKYSSPGSEVVLKAQVSDKELVLSVSDQGDSIPVEEKQRIFEKFYRIGEEKTRKTKGSGLGLYITKLIVKWHGGEIVVKDNQPKGTKFVVRLPLQQ